MSEEIDNALNEFLRFGNANFFVIDKERIKAKSRLLDIIVKRLEGLKIQTDLPEEFLIVNEAIDEAITSMRSLFG